MTGIKAVTTSIYRAVESLCCRTRNQANERIRKVFKAPDLTDQIQTVFGGLEKFQQLPELQLNRHPQDKSYRVIPTLDLGYIDFVKTKDMSDDVMVGVDQCKRPFVCLKMKDKNGSEPFVVTLFQRYTGYRDIWSAGTCYGSASSLTLDFASKNEKQVNLLSAIVNNRDPNYQLASVGDQRVPVVAKKPKYLLLAGPRNQAPVYTTTKKDR